MSRRVLILRESRVVAVNNWLHRHSELDIRSGGKYTFAVKPEGSVLSRTVIKTRKGWTADNTGTVEGFAKLDTELVSHACWKPGMRVLFDFRELELKGMSA